MEGPKTGKTLTTEETQATPMMELAYYNKPDPKLTSEQHPALNQHFREYRNPNMNTSQVLFKKGDELYQYWHFNTLELMAPKKPSKEPSKEPRSNAGKWSNNDYLRNKKPSVCCYCKKFTDKNRKAAARKVRTNFKRALEDLEKLSLSSGYQKADDIWENLEAFEKLKLSPGCQNAGDTSQDF